MNYLNGTTKPSNSNTSNDNNINSGDNNLEPLEIDFVTILPIVLIVIMVSYFIFLFILYEKEEIIPLSNVDEFKLLDENNPLVAGCILQNRNLQPRDIVATLLNLVNKKVLKLAKKKKKNGEYIYEVSKSSDGNIKSLSDIEIFIYDWFMIEDEKIELISRLKAFSKSDDTQFKIYRLQQVVDKYLEKIGVNRRHIPISIKKANTIMSLVIAIFVFFHIIYISFMSNSDIKIIDIGMNNLVTNIIILIVLLLIPLILISILYIAQVVIYRKIGINKIIKVPINNFLIFMALYSLVAIAFMTLDTMLFNDIRFTYDIILIIITVAVLLSDKLMSKNEKAIVKLMSKMNMIKNKIEDILGKENEAELEKRNIADKYFCYGISLGISDRLLIKIPDVKQSDIFDIDIMKKEANSAVRKYKKLTER